jgi:hypothetical protein
MQSSGAITVYSKNTRLFIIIDLPDAPDLDSVPEICLENDKNPTNSSTIYVERVGKCLNFAIFG